MRATLFLAATLALGSTAGSAHALEPWQEDPLEWGAEHFGVEVFYDEHELEEIEFEEDLEQIFGDGIGDVERRRAGLRLLYGTREIQGFAQLFFEEIDDFDQSDLLPGRSLQIDDLFGVGVGIRGEPFIEQIREDAELVFVYRADASVVSGDGTFRDTGVPTPLASNEEEDDVVYFDYELLAGVGVDVHGWRPAVGIYGNFLAGAVDDGIVASNADDDLYFEGFNAGLFAELAWHPEGVPLSGGIRATAGDVTGFEAFLRATL